ncbi:MFS transporter [Saccharopolyspora hattusasensis]|uniref:MFS transporter n=1 Tax=Saccharopolyspora hattusasensis TaxID=1128679 RepID=UPI003D963189
MIDWYDFFLYGIAAATIFGPQYFPTEDKFVGVLASMGSFAVGFVFRPMGGAIFGHFGDRIGRRRMLFITVVLMGLASAAIGALPTYDTIGVAAPILLVLLRVVQGIAVGGEWGGAALMAVESAPEGKKNFLSSGVQFGSFIGLILGTAMFALMQSLTTQAQFEAWGWRIPFLISLVFAVLGLLIRLGVAESTEFVEAKENHQRVKSPLQDALRTAPLQILAVIGMRLVDQASFYIAFTFSLVYVKNYTDHSTSTVLTAQMIALVLGCILTPTYAKFADRVGVRWFYIVGPLCSAAAAIPFFLALRSDSLLLLSLALFGLINLGHNISTAVQPTWFTGMFDVSVRYSGAGFGFALAGAVGGFIPLAATALAGHDGNWLGSGLLLAGLCLAALVTSLFAYRWTTAGSAARPESA